MIIARALAKLVTAPIWVIPYATSKARPKKCKCRGRCRCRR